MLGGRRPSVRRARGRKAHAEKTDWPTMTRIPAQAKIMSRRDPAKKNSRSITRAKQNGRMARFTFVQQREMRSAWWDIKESEYFRDCFC